jgi:hypothetical protein
MGSGCVGNCEGAVRSRKFRYVMLRELSRSHSRPQMYLDTSVRERTGSGSSPRARKVREACDGGERFAFRQGCIIFSAAQTLLVQQDAC